MEEKEAVTMIAGIVVFLALLIGTLTFLNSEHNRALKRYCIDRHGSWQVYSKGEGCAFG